MRLPSTIFLLSFMWLLVSTGSAQNVHISGGNASYAGKKLSLYSFSDPITRSKDELKQLVAGTDGKFDVHIQLQSPQQLFLKSGAFVFLFYAQPGEALKLPLPDYKAVPEAHRQSAYFREELIRLRIDKAGEELINDDIFVFEQAFDAYLNRHLRAIFEQHSQPHLDSLMQIARTHEERTKKTFVKQFINYKRAYARYFFNPRKGARIFSACYAHHPVLFDNPAYFEPFRALSTDFLKGYRSLRSDTAVEALIHAKNYSRLKAVIAEEKDFSGTFTDLLLLQCLYDGFYKKDYPTGKILALVKQIATSGSSARIREVASGVYKKLTCLMPGTPAPQFELPDASGKKVSLNAFKGKYAYLCFIRTGDFASKEYLRFLPELKKQFGNDLEIVCITRQDDFKAATAYFAKNGYTFQLLHDTGNTTRKYNVVVAPSFVLIGRKGEIVNAPAPSPAEHFAKALANIMRKERVELLWEQAK